MLYGFMFIFKIQDLKIFKLSFLILMDAIGNVLPQVIKQGASEEKGEVARLVIHVLFSLLSSELLQLLTLSKLHWDLGAWIKS